MAWQAMQFFFLARSACANAGKATTLYYAHNYDSDQGRYMYPSLLPIATFIAIGLTALFPEKYHRWVLDTVIVAFAAINVVVLSRLAAIWQI